MRKAALFLIVTVLALGIFSCKKDEADNTIKIGLVTKIFKGSFINSEIQYDASNRPIKMLLYGVTGFPDGYVTYEFGDDSLVDKVRIYSQQGIVTSFTTYLYDTLQRLLTKKYYQIQSSNSKLLYSEAFFYNTKNQLINHSEFDSSGNVKYMQEQIYDTLDDPSEIKYFKPDNSYAGSLYYNYDHKPNVFAGFQKKLGTSHPYNKHNITKITSSIAPVNGDVTFNLGNTSLKISLYSTTYEYDFNNLPTKEISTYLSGKVESESYEYK